MKIIGIYKITCIKTKKVYIGQSRDIKKRWNEHKRMPKDKISKLYNSFKKHGIKNHKFEIIHRCEIDDLNRLERYYQELYNCTDRKYGLNLVLQDADAKQREFTDEWKELMKTRPRRDVSGKNNPRYGKKHSEETKKLFSEQRKGKLKGVKNPSARKCEVINLDTLEIHRGCMKDIEKLLNCEVELVWHRLIGIVKKPAKLREWSFKYEDEKSVDDFERYLNTETGIYYHYRSEVYEYCEKYLGYKPHTTNEHLNGKRIKKDIPFIIV